LLLLSFENCARAVGNERSNDFCSPFILLLLLPPLLPLPTQKAENEDEDEEEQHKLSRPRRSKPVVCAHNELPLKPRRKCILFFFFLSVCEEFFVCFPAT